MYFNSVLRLSTLIGTVVAIALLSSVPQSAVADKPMTTICFLSHVFPDGGLGSGVPYEGRLFENDREIRLVCRGVVMNYTGQRQVYDLGLGEGQIPCLVKPGRVGNVGKLQGNGEWTRAADLHLRQVNRRRR